VGRATGSGRRELGHTSGNASRQGAGAARAKVGRRVGAAGAYPPAASASLGWRDAIATTVVGLGYDLVDIERAQRGLLRVTIDRQPGRSYPSRTYDGAETAPVDSGEFVTVDDCEQVSRQLQYVLAVENLAYARLEVSSPGLDRPLKSEADFARFAGRDVSVTLKEPFQGRKAWRGVLGSAADGSGWQLVFEQGSGEQVLGFGFDEVREARLVPVLDFKGRKPAAPAPEGGHTGGARPAASSDEGG
jgi:ribosome maturation factor RimP